MPLNFLEQLIGPFVILLLIASIVVSYFIFKKTHSVRLSLLTTLFPPISTIISMIFVSMATDNTPAEGLATVAVALLGVIASVVVFAITAIMLAVLKKNLKK